MTLAEVVLAGGLIVFALLTAAGIYDHHLNRAKVRQMSDLIRGLHQAMVAYHEATGAYPPGREDAACDPALAAMQTVAASATQIRDIGSRLLFLSDGKLRCIDPWGLPLRYFTTQSDDAEHHRRLEANGGVPIFESAGPDRDFGDEDSARQADNICSDDPM